MKRIRILVADEQPVFCEDLRNLLTPDGHIEVVGEARDARKAVELAAELTADVILLDFPLCQKPEVTESDEVRCSLARFPLLVMVRNPEKDDVVEAFRLGARGVVLKGSPPQRWFESIRTVVGGEYWLGGQSAEILVNAVREFLPHVTKPASFLGYDLTPRELEIVERIARGRSNREVGLEFSICEKTVKHHLTNIFTKLGVSSRLALAMFARDNNILPYIARNAARDTERPDESDSDGNSEAEPSSEEFHLAPDPTLT